MSGSDLSSQIKHCPSFKNSSARTHAFQDVIPLSCTDSTLCLCVFWRSFAEDTCAVGSSAVNVVIRFPLLGDLVGVDEDDHHGHQADEGHQHRRAQRRVDVGDEAPTKGGKGRSE